MLKVDVSSNPREYKIKSRSNRINHALNHERIAFQFTQDDCDLLPPEGDYDHGFVIYEDDHIRISQADYDLISEEIDLILNNMSTPGGVVKGSVYEEVRRSGCCLRTSVIMEGEKTKSTYHTPINCGKWFCPVCGSKKENGKVKKGEIQRERIKSVITRLNRGVLPVTMEEWRSFAKRLKGMTMIQYVFTVPEKFSSLFMSKEMLNRLFSSARRIISKLHEDTGQIAYIHIFGDEGDKFHPHVNVHVFYEGSVRVVPKEGEDKILSEVKNRWAKALESHGCDFEGDYTVSVHKSFLDGSRSTIGQMMHRIKYMCKPVDQCFFLKWKNEKKFDLLRFAICAMKGFRFIRYWGKLSNAEYDEFCADGEDDMNLNEKKKEFEKILGERLIFKGISRVPISELQKRPDYEVSRVSRNLYKVKYIGGGKNEKT